MVILQTANPQQSLSDLDEDFDGLHSDLQECTSQFAEEIAGPTVWRATVVDRLLDLRNLGNGRDLGLQLTIDDMLESLPINRAVSSEWWLSCLSELTDHAVFLAAGYPPVIPDYVGKAVAP